MIWEFHFGEYFFFFVDIDSLKSDHVEVIERIINDHPHLLSQEVERQKEENFHKLKGCGAYLE